MCAGSISVCYAVARFLFALCVQYNVRIYRAVHVFNIISLGLQLESSQVHQTKTPIRVPEASTLTSRPPKPLTIQLRTVICNLYHKILIV